MSEAIPQYMKIRQYVFGNVASQKSAGGSLKIHTEAELCKIFGVCRKTVRKALDQLVEEGLLVRKASLGTFIRPEIADNYAMCYGEKLAIGLVYKDGMATFLDDIYLVQTEKIIEQLKAFDCVVRLIFFNGSPEQEAEQLSKSKLDGIIWMSPDREHMPVLRIFKSCNIPVVSTLPDFISDEFDCVTVDYYKSGYAVAKKLLSDGHRKILYINKHPSDVEAAKKAGWMAAFAECGVKWHEQLWQCSAKCFATNRFKEILEQCKDVSAVNCHEMYIYQVKRELTGRKDIQIIHNIFRASAAIREGTPEIMVPAAQAAGFATEMLLEEIKHPGRNGKARQIFIESEIVEPEIYKTSRVLSATPEAGTRSAAQKRKSAECGRHLCVTA